jgi:hypothetical protein
MLRGFPSRQSGRVYGLILGIYRIFESHWLLAFFSSTCIILYILASSLSILVPASFLSGLFFFGCKKLRGITYKMKYPWVTNKINHKPPIIPTSAQANAGHNVSAWADKVAFAAPAVIPERAVEGVKKSVYSSATYFRLSIAQWQRGDGEGEEILTRHFPTAGTCFVAELMINPAAAANDDRTASMLRREYHR